MQTKHGTLEKGNISEGYQCACRQFTLTKSAWPGPQEQDAHSHVATLTVRSNVKWRIPCDFQRDNFNFLTVKDYDPGLVKSIDSLFMSQFMMLWDGYVILWLYSLRC
jgi:hypothetical protein